MKCCPVELFKRALAAVVGYRFAVKLGEQRASHLLGIVHGAAADGAPADMGCRDDAQRWIERAGGKGQNGGGIQMVMNVQLSASSVFRSRP